MLINYDYYKETVSHPGKYEGENPATPYYDANPDSDDIIFGDGIFEPDLFVYYITPLERATFDLDGEVYVIFEDDMGFVHGRVYESLEQLSEALA